MGEDRRRLIGKLVASAVQALPGQRTPVPEGARTAEPRRLGPAPARTGRAPDTTYASVLVHRHSNGGREAFGVEAWCQGVETLPYTTGDDFLRPYDISLGHARRGGTAPSELFKSIERWSGYQHPLTEWINRCRQAHGDALQLVILDETGFDLPWEALILPAVPAAGLPEGPLGALVDMARWLGGFPVEVAAPSGAVVGFFHSDMMSDQNFFQSYEHRPHFGIETFLKSLDDLPAKPTGMVYMGCHGTFDHEVLANLTLAGATWADYQRHGMQVLGREHALVCLNACHSGRLLDYDRDGRQGLRGFTQVFLEKGAGGCIVSAGEVGDAEARVMIRRIVDTVTEDPERPVARALRSFRADVHTAFAAEGDVPMMVRDDGTFDTDRQRSVLRLLYSLMFQYYGHPLSTVRLSGRSQGGPDRTEAGAP
ncbi:CHAT domain-containing protein [Streptomyces sp. NBC_01220]|uniref:CHAT domain-containing protein n=1 Tax=Streptomyces sp. NBC_01220 TaxID=2903781 RepID=UPI00352E1EC6|nr:CHAT domain-containing protein [Streptomyces sp. NBC_01220]